MKWDTLNHLIQNSESYALLSRSDSANGTSNVELIIGNVRKCKSIKDINPQERSLVVIPFKQVAERGFECKEDNKQILVLDQKSKHILDQDLLINNGSGSISMASPMYFQTTDEQYASLVGKVIKEEIGRGECSNVVLSRSLKGVLGKQPQTQCFRLFCNLLALESGYYWAFLIRTPWVTLVGASPERHVKLKDGEMAMTAISGTASLFEIDNNTIKTFLSDQKEKYELCMVVDEELKMMARCCHLPPVLRGPFLRQMSKVAHTEYELTGNSYEDATTVMFETMFAPSVVGSPLQNSLRVITRWENSTRSYYSGFIAILEGSDNCSLDSTITIRTAEITDDGTMCFRVGSTITRDSKGILEAKETRNKSEAFIAALNYKGKRNEKLLKDQNLSSCVFPISKEISELISKQSSNLSKFWMNSRSSDNQLGKPLDDIYVTIVDLEDNFTFMWEKILESMGARVSILNYSSGSIFNKVKDGDITILGPGPGNPLVLTEDRQKILSRIINELVWMNHPTLSVCLSHQILCMNIGIKVRRRDLPNQGVQKKIIWNGRDELAGFYNTFEAYPTEENVSENVYMEVSFDGSIDILCLSKVTSFQFHPESILTPNGDIIISEAILGLLE